LTVPLQVEEEVTNKNCKAPDGKVELKHLVGVSRAVGNIWRTLTHLQVVFSTITPPKKGPTANPMVATSISIAM
jgi:hypothetical protein